MSVERDRILQMIETGAISAEEAEELLDAMGDTAAPAGTDAATPSPPTAGPPTFRKPWQIPFAGGLVALLAGVYNLGRLSRRDAGLFARATAWVMVLVAAAATVLAYLSRDAPWLHIYVHDKDGDHVTINLPLPLGLAGWLIDLARPYVDDETTVHLDTAAEFLRALREDPHRDPLMLEVEDEDDRVEIYLG